MTVLTKDNLFTPPRSKSETKAETTNQAARSIMDVEAKAREAKTARLREARLVREAEQAAIETDKPKKVTRKKAK